MRGMLLLAMGLAWSIVGMGCATALNVQDASMRKPYGGVTMPITEFFGGNDSGEAAEFASVLFFPVWFLDKPLSLLGDTLTLPYIFYAQRNPPPSLDYRKPRLIMTETNGGSSSAK